jgi:hypothetical protein
MINKRPRYQTYVFDTILILILIFSNYPTFTCFLSSYLLCARNYKKIKDLSLAQDLLKVELYKILLDLYFANAINPLESYSYRLCVRIG